MIEPMYHLTPDTSAQAVRIIESWASIQWKVLGHHYTRADMIQEGHLVLNRVVTRYPSRGDNHLLSTLAASLQNRSNDLSRRPDRDATVTDLTTSEGFLASEASTEDSFDRDYPGWLEALLAFTEGGAPRQLKIFQADEGDEYLAKKVGLPAGAPVRQMALRALGAA
jgi:hypothetical protein